MDASVDVPTTPSPLSPAEMATFTSIATNSQLTPEYYMVSTTEWTFSWSLLK